MEYQVMPDIREKEKIVGGLFTITQTAFLIVGVLVGGILCFITFSVTQSPIISLPMFVVGAMPFIPFAFITVEKMGKMELFFYLLIKYKYKKMQKVYMNLNENQRNRILEDLNV